MLIVWLDLCLAWWEGHRQWPGLRILPHILPGQQQAKIHKTNTQKSLYPPLAKKSLEEKSVYTVVHFNTSRRTMMVVMASDEKPQESSVSWCSHYSRLPSHLISVYTTYLADLLRFPSPSNSYLDCFSKLCGLETWIWTVFMTLTWNFLRTILQVTSPKLHSVQ